MRERESGKFQSAVTQFGKQKDITVSTPADDYTLSESSNHTLKTPHLSFTNLACGQVHSVQNDFFTEIKRRSNAQQRW